MKTEPWQNTVDPVQEPEPRSPWRGNPDPGTDEPDPGRDDPDLKDEDVKDEDFPAGDEEDREGYTGPDRRTPVMPVSPLDTFIMP